MADRPDSESTQPLRSESAAARAEMGVDLIVQAVRVVDEWEDSADSSVALVYRLWKLYGAGER